MYIYATKHFHQYHKFYTLITKWSLSLTAHHNKKKNHNVSGSFWATQDEKVPEVKDTTAL
jgi:hypothetical protein